MDRHARSHRRYLMRAEVLQSFCEALIWFLTDKQTLNQLKQCQLARLHCSVCFPGSPGLLTVFRDFSGDLWTATRDRTDAPCCDMKFYVFLKSSHMISDGWANAQSAVLAPID